MDRKYINLYRVEERLLEWMTLSSALFISIFLAIAAYGKFFYPAEKLKQLDLFTSLFEVVFILLLFLFRMRPLLWLGAAIVFAAWGGYATYWCCLKMPCSCIGAMIDFPSSYALSLDAVFFVLSIAIAFSLGAVRSVLYLAVLSACLFTLIGYGFAEWVFYEKIVGVIWRFF